MKRLWFRLLGVDPDAVVVTYWTGGGSAARAMFDEVRAIIPDRRHFVVAIGEAPALEGVPVITLPDLPAGELWLRLRRSFKGLRIGMAAVLFAGDTRFAALCSAAFLLSPRKVLAYNARLDRHHLQLASPLASFLFWRGVPLDRIWLRPRGWPGRKERSSEPEACHTLEGRPQSSARARVAFLTPYFPYPLSHGGAVRIFHLLREASRTCNIHLFSFTERETRDDFLPLLEFCSRLTLVEKPRYREPRWASLLPPEVAEYRSAAMERELRACGAPVLQVEYTQLAPYLGDILVEHDITFDLYRQVYESRPGLSTWWDWFRWRRFERNALRRARSVVVMSPKDAVLSQAPNPCVIPNGVDLNRFQPSDESPGFRILFIGSLRHFPNVGALQFLLRQVWPAIIARFPAAELTVVAGPDPAAHWPERQLPRIPNVRILEFVSDVRPLYNGTNLVVVPTLVSAGTNIKVLEAMAMSRAIVSTASGCAGLGLVHGDSVWVADGAGAFIEGVSRLLSDPDLRAGLAASARRHAEQHFSWRRLGALQRKLLALYAPSPLILRQAEASDLPAIERLIQKSPEAARWDAASCLDYSCILAELQGHVLAFLLSRQTGPQEAEILNLAVDPGHRRLGLASQLLTSFLDDSRQEIFLEVRQSNLPARDLYRGFGFDEVGIRQNYYQDPPDTAIVMRLRSC